MPFSDWLKRLLYYEFYVLLIVTFGAMVSQSLLTFAVSISILFGFIRYLAHRGSWWPAVTPVDLSILGLCLMLPIAWWTTIDGKTTGWQILRLLNGVGLFYAVIHWLSGQVSVARLHKLILAFDAIGLFIVAIGLVSTKWPVGKSRLFDHVYHYLIPFSTESIHPNVLAGTIILFLPIPLLFFLMPFAIQRRQGKGAIAALYHVRWLFWQGVTALCLLSSLLLTQSRGAVLGLIATALILVFRLGGKRQRAFLLGGLLVVGGLSFLFPHDSWTFISQFTSDSAVSTGALRLEVWSRAYYMIQDFPFTGIGMGNFQQILEQLYPLFSITEVIPHAHNLFLQIAADLGIVGLVCWLAIILGVTASLCVVIKCEAVRLEQPCSFVQYTLATALLGSQAALLAHGLVDAVTWSSVRTAPFIWMLWGTAVALNLPGAAGNSLPTSDSPSITPTAQNHLHS